MDDYIIEKMNPEAVLVDLADNYGKRKPGTNMLLRSMDFTPEVAQTWAQNYVNSPRTGRPSDDFFRRNADRHVVNGQRFIKARAHWVELVSHTTLEELCDKLQTELGPTLRPLKS